MDRIRVPNRLIRYGIILTHTIRMALKDVESKLEEMDDEEPKPKQKRTRRAKAA
jgi:hypothetical protein